VQNTVDRSPQSLLEATARSSGSRQAGGAAIAVESMAMPAELGGAHHRRNKVADRFHLLGCGAWVNFILRPLPVSSGEA
jgi:hypothetical protein